MSVTYNRVNWANYPSTTTRLNAANLNKMDQGIADLAAEVNNVQSEVSGLNNSLDNIDVRYTTEHGAEWSPRGAGTWNPFNSLPDALNYADGYRVMVMNLADQEIINTGGSGTKTFTTNAGVSYTATCSASSSGWSHYVKFDRDVKIVGFDTLNDYFEQDVAAGTNLPASACMIWVK